MSQIDSSELDEFSGEENPHGFVYASTLDTFRKAKKDRVAEELVNRENDRDAHKD